MYKCFLALSIFGVAFQAQAITIPAQFSAYVHGACTSDEDALDDLNSYPTEKVAEAALNKVVEKEVDGAYVYSCERQGVVTYEKFVTQNEDGSLFCPGTSAKANYKCSMSW